MKDYHHNIINELFAEDKNIILNDINTLFKSLDKKLNLKPTTNYDYEYDQIVVYGELLSTKIIHHYLKTTGVWNIWFDARKVIITDNTFKEAKVNWELTSDEIDFSIASKYKNNENRFISIKDAASNDPSVANVLSDLQSGAIAANAPCDAMYNKWPEEKIKELHSVLDEYFPIN